MSFWPLNTDTHAPSADGSTALGKTRNGCATRDTSQVPYREIGVEGDACVHIGDRSTCVCTRSCDSAFRMPASLVLHPNSIHVS